MSTESRVTIDAIFVLLEFQACFTLTLDQAKRERCGRAPLARRMNPKPRLAWGANKRTPAGGGGFVGGGVWIDKKQEGFDRTLLGGLTYEELVFGAPGAKNSLAHQPCVLREMLTISFFPRVGVRFWVNVFETVTVRLTRHVSSSRERLTAGFIHPRRA